MFRWLFCRCGLVHLSYYCTTFGDATVVMVVNWSDDDLSLTSFASQTVGVVPGPDESLMVQDLWTNKLVDIWEQDRDIPLPVIAPHASVVYRLKTSTTPGPSHAEMEIS